MDEDLSSPRVEQRIQELHVQTKQYIGNSRTPGIVESMGEKRQYIEYIAIPIVILGFLVIIRPYFIMSEMEDEKGERSYRLDIKKTFTFWLGGTVVCVVGLYGYKYKTMT